MNTLELTEIDVNDGMVHITRHFDAPRSAVFAAWTTAESLARWFAPLGCTLEIGRFEFRPGGGFLTCIRNPDYPECWCTGTYHEIVAPERITFSMALCDGEGNMMESDAAGKDPEWPVETIVVVEFAERDGGTALTLHQNVSEALAKRTGAHPSWLQMLDRLAAMLATR